MLFFSRVSVFLPFALNFFGKVNQNHKAYKREGCFGDIQFGYNSRDAVTKQPRRNRSFNPDILLRKNSRGNGKRRDKNYPAKPRILGNQSSSALVARDNYQHNQKNRDNSYTSQSVLFAYMPQNNYPQGQRKTHDISDNIVFGHTGKSAEKVDQKHRQRQNMYDIVQNIHHPITSNKSV